MQISSLYNWHLQFDNQKYEKTHMKTLVRLLVADVSGKPKSRSLAVLYIVVVLYYIYVHIYIYNTPLAVGAMRV